MAKGKGRTSVSHQDNYRRGGLRLDALGSRWFAKKNVAPQELLSGLSPQRRGEGMNGMNNPLGALSALAGLAQSKNDPMAALSALSALSGKPAGGAAAAGQAAGSGGTSANPADLITILSKLKPQGGNPTPPPNNGANPAHNAANQGNVPPPTGNQAGAFSNQSGNPSKQAFAQGNYQDNQQAYQGRNAYQPQEKSAPRSRRQSDLRQRAQRLYAEEPQSGCEGCAEHCAGSFRNYPSWSEVNAATVPWRRKND